MLLPTPLLDALFLRHPREQGEAYLEHGRFAASVGVRMVLGGLACLVHAVVPALFTTTGSRTLRRLSQDLAGRRPRGAALGGGGWESNPPPA